MTSYKNIIKELGCTTKLSSNAYSATAKQKVLDEKVENYGFIRGKLLNMEGICELDGMDYSDREYFQRAKEGEVYFTEPLEAKTDGKSTLIVAAPLWENGQQDTQIVGVVWVALPADILNDIMNDIQISENCSAYMIDKEGTVITHSEESMINKNNIKDVQTDSSLKKIAALEKKMIKGESGFDIYRNKMTIMFLSYSPIENTNGWSIGINAPIMDFFKPLFMSVVVVIVLVGGAIALASVIAIHTGRKIGEPIRLCAERLNKVMEGDLQSEVPVIHTNDETAVLANSTKAIVDGLNEIIGDTKNILSKMAVGDFTVHTQAEESYVGDFAEILKSVRGINRSLNEALRSIQEASDEVSAGSEEMAIGAQALSEGAKEQAGAVENLFAHVADTTKQVEKNAQAARETSAEAVEIGKAANDSTKNMKEVVAAMERIRTASNEIANIIQTIEEIASQTNLLALNASIEAARAGEAGKGFAVVADEIGKLANESAKAAENTRKLIETAISEVEGGNLIVENTVTVLMNAIQGMDSIVLSIESVAESSRQQSSSMKKINDGIEQISVVVGENSVTAQKSFATSEELSAQAVQLKEQVEHFKLR